MTDKPKKLSGTARALLSAAAAHDDRLIRPPKLPVAAARQVARSLLAAGLAEQIRAPVEDTGYVWRQGGDGSNLVLRTTASGLARISDAEGNPSLQPEATPAAAKPSNAVQETTVPVRAASVLPVTGHPRRLRDTKQARVLAMLSRREGASGPQIAEATGWAPHTVRGFLAGLAKKGIKVEVLERIRQVGPNKVGARGSYTIYRIGDGRS